jgi:CBS domain-containing protein
MFCRHYMVRSGAAQSTILDTATLGEALARMIKHHMQQLLLVNEAGEFVGEVTTFTLAKLLLTDGSGTTREEAEAAVGDVDDRIMPHLGRRVRDFAEHDLPVVSPDTPLMEAVRLLASGKLPLAGRRSQHQQIRRGHLPAHGLTPVSVLIQSHGCIGPQAGPIPESLSARVALQSICRVCGPPLL